METALIDHKILYPIKLTIVNCKKWLQAFNSDHKNMWLKLWKHIAYYNV